MNNWGFIIKEITNDTFSQQVIDLISNFVIHNKRSNVCLFTTNVDTIDTKNVPILHISHASFFDCKWIVLDIDSMVFVKDFIHNNTIIYYANNIPWSKKVYSFTELNTLFAKSSISKVISSTPEIAEVYNRCFGHESIVSNNLIYSELYEQLQ